MGQTLSEPVIEKVSDSGADERVIYGLSAMQGWRVTMEDDHAAVLDLQAEQAGQKFVGAPDETRLSFFGVYDGHGGDGVAHFAGKNVHKIIAKQQAFKEGNLEQAMKDGFLATDRAILSDPEHDSEPSGCTASVGIISNSKIYVANAGDSRAVLGIKGRAKPLSFDHKPQNDGEKARIMAAGGFVDFGRVNGNLALSRAIGDFEFKKSADLSPEAQIVTAYPEVTMHEISDNDEFLVIACDGIWDCQSSQAVVEFVRRGIAARQELSRICENLMDNCLAASSDTGGVGCDNMTMIIIGLLRGKSKDEWYEEVGKRVAAGDGPCAPPEYAEFRGPGVHHRFEDSEEYDADLDHRNTRRPTGPSGQVILLGDGNDPHDSEMFDHDEEDRDLSAQIDRVITPSSQPLIHTTTSPEAHTPDTTSAESQTDVPENASTLHSSATVETTQPASHPTNVRSEEAKS